MTSAQIHARPGNVLSQSPRFAIMSRACRQRCRLEIGHEFDMRFTSEAARFGSLVLPATSPLTASMPSTVGLCDGPALRLAMVTRVRPWLLLCERIGKQFGKQLTPTQGLGNFSTAEIPRSGTPPKSCQTLDKSLDRLEKLLMRATSRSLSAPYPVSAESCGIASLYRVNSISGVTAASLSLAMWRKALTCSTS